MGTENRLTLMVVDDDASSRMILKQIFSGSYDIIEAVDGKFALELIRKGTRPDLLILDLNMPEVDGYDVLDELHRNSEFRHIPIIIATADSGSAAKREAFYLGAVGVITKPFHPDTIRYSVENILSSIKATKIMAENNLRYRLSTENSGDVAGIWGRQRFIDEVSEFLLENPDGQYVIARWDMDHFKLFNDNFGNSEGDALLREIGQKYQNGTERFGPNKPLFYAHWGADHFVALYDATTMNPDFLYRYTLMQLNTCHDNFDFAISYGFYRIDDTSLQVATMCDRAALALRSIKNRYDVHYCWYDNTMLDRIVEEQEITSTMKKALKRGEFVPYFQPQYNYVTGAMIGAEALVRWLDPQKGVVPPGKFVPIFEKNGFISAVDYCIWESSCSYIRQWLDKGYKVPPIAVNISRHDLYDIHLCDKLCALIEKYNLTTDMLHLEITESAYMDNPEQLLSVIDTLKAKGFYVEMDDFGSGFSSLNTLRDVPVDMLKLDMKFLGDSTKSGRGGSILSSVVRLAHGINLPVIAEGVETKQQADYLKTINCHYMQGYLFSKPIPASEFEKLIEHESKDAIDEKRFTNAIDHSIDFLDASTQATLLFNSFVGGAAIFDFENGNINILRLNDRFYEELRVPKTTFDDLHGHFMHFLESGSRVALIDAIKMALSTNSETACQVHFKTRLSGNPEQWLNIRLRYLASRFDSHIFYASIDNISARKILEKALFREKMSFEQILRFAPGGIAEFIVQDGDLTRIFLSEAAHDILGYTIANKPTSTLNSQLRKIHPDDRKRVKSTIYDAIGEGRDFYIEFRLLLTSGGIRWISLSANATTIDSELHYFGIYTDISRNKADEALRRQHLTEGSLTTASPSSILGGAWEQYLKNTDDYVFVKDINSIYLSVSDSFVKMAGYNSADEIIGKTDYDIFKNANIAAQYAKIDMDVLSSGESRVNYIEASNSADSSDIALSQTSKYAIRDDDGTVIGLYCISRDITASHALEEYKLSLESAGKNIFRYAVKGRVFRVIEQDDESLSPISITGGPEYIVSQGNIATESIERWYNLFKAIDDGERGGSTDIQLISNTGEYNWYRFKFKSIFDNDGKPFSAIISYKNVDDYHRMENDKLLERACVYGSMSALYPLYMAANLTQNRILSLNGNLEGLPLSKKIETYDDSFEEMLKNCSEKNAKKFKTNFNREKLLETFENDQMLSVFLEMQFTDGKMHTVECVSIPIKDPLGSDILVTGLLREIK